jgi:hypothetical protein
MTVPQLKAITDENVVILQFVKKTDNKMRMMTCTTCLPLLQSQEGIIHLHYRKATNSPPYNPLPDNLIVWDINKEDYRQIPANRVRIQQTIPALDYLKMLRGR